jgi:hypothetical protein
MFAYDTVAQAVNGLKDRGFTMDFNLENDHIRCQGHPERLGADEFEIVEVYRFEGNSDPGDEAIVYGIQSKHGIKGVLVNGFGISADSLSNTMIEKLRILHESPTERKGNS